VNAVDGKQRNAALAMTTPNARFPALCARERGESPGHPELDSQRAAKFPLSVGVARDLDLVDGSSAREGDLQRKPREAIRRDLRWCPFLALL